MKDVHVFPTDDPRPHEIDRACWCDPKQDDICPNVWIHKETVLQ